MPFPVERPRRLRRTPAMRRLVAETRLHPAGLVLPLFVREGLDEPAPIASLPGVVQHSRASMRAAAREAVGLGLGGVMLFGVPTSRDARGQKSNGSCANGCGQSASVRAASPGGWRSVGTH